MSTGGEVEGQHDSAQTQDGSDSGRVSSEMVAFLPPLRPLTGDLEELPRRKHKKYASKFRDRILEERRVRMEVSKSTRHPSYRKSRLEDEWLGGNNSSYITSVRRLGMLVMLVDTSRKVRTSQARVRVRYRYGAPLKIITLLLLKDLWEHSSRTGRSVSFHLTGSTAPHRYIMPFKLP